MSSAMMVIVVAGVVGVMVMMVVARAFVRS